MANDKECVDELLLQAYADGQVSEAEQAQIDTHLHRCQRCARTLSTIRTVIRLVEDLPPVEPPSHFVQNVMTGLPADLYVPVKRRLMLPWLLIALTITGSSTVLIMIAAGVIAWGAVFDTALLMGRDLCADAITLVSWVRTLLNVFLVFPNTVAVGMGVSLLVFGWGILRLMVISQHQRNHNH